MTNIETSPRDLQPCPTCGKSISEGSLTCIDCAYKPPQESNENVASLDAEFLDADLLDDQLIEVELPSSRIVTILVLSTITLPVVCFATLTVFFEASSISSSFAIGAFTSFAAGCLSFLGFFLPIFHSATGN